jgi:preprotein translocase subunit YajC
MIFMNKLIYAFVSAQVFVFRGALFADETTEVLPPRDQGLWQTISMISIALVFFYFILWRPEQKRRKALDEQRGAMKKGDRVTAMGILGTIARVQEHSVILKMVDGSKIEVLKAAITDVVPGLEHDVKKVDKEDKNKVEILESDED